jgi:hypothetical protein
MPEKNFVRLSVGGILKETFCFFKNHFKEIMKVACIPVLLFVILYILCFVCFMHLFSELKQSGFHTRFFVLLVGYGILLTSICFASVTQFILSVSHLAVTGQIEKRLFRNYWKKRHAKIFGYSLFLEGLFLGALILLFGLTVFFVSFCSDLTPNIFIISFSVLGGIGLLYSLTRFSLIIPAVSVGFSATLGWSWRQMKGNSFRFLAIMMPFFITTLLSELLFRTILLIPVNILCTILSIIATGLVYKEFESKGALLPG